MWKERGFKEPNAHLHQKTKLTCACELPDKGSHTSVALITPQISAIIMFKIICRQQKELIQLSFAKLEQLNLEYV